MPITLWLLVLIGSLGEVINRQRLVVVGKELSKISKMRNCPIWPSGPPHTGHKRQPFCTQIVKAGAGEFTLTCVAAPPAVGNLPPAYGHCHHHCDAHRAALDVELVTEMKVIWFHSRIIGSPTPLNCLSGGTDKLVRFNFHNSKGGSYPRVARNTG
jgi:hypothetical protein